MHFYTPYLYLAILRLLGTHAHSILRNIWWTFSHRNWAILQTQGGPNTIQDSEGKKFKEELKRTKKTIYLEPGVLTKSRYNVDIQRLSSTKEVKKVFFV